MKSIFRILTGSAFLLLAFAVTKASAEELLIPATQTMPVKQALTPEKPAANLTAAVGNNESTSFLMQTSSLQTASQPLTSEDGYFTGIKSGAVLSGNAVIQINTKAGLNVKKVAYYLNGTQAGKIYTAPFTFGGTGGYDTTKLANGNYTLSGYITTASGDVKFSYAFKVDNSGALSDPVSSPDTVDHRSSVGFLPRNGTWEYNPVDVVNLAGADGVKVSSADFTMLMNRARQQTGTTQGSTYYSLYEPYYMAYQSGDYSAIAISASERDKFSYGCTNGCVTQTQTGGAYTIFLFRSPKHPDGIVFEVPHYLRSGEAYGFSPAGELVVNGTFESPTVLIYNQDGKQIATADKAVPATAPSPAPATVPQPAPVPSPSAGADMTGITSGATVSGTVLFGPNLKTHPDVRKVSYYLNGAQSGKVYSTPYYWGGTSGFDTKKLANGTYTLSGYYTTASGDQRFQSVTFTVKN